VPSSWSFEGTYLLHLQQLVKLKPLSSQYNITSKTTRILDYAAVNTSKFTILYGGVETLKDSRPSV
jgi:hypothetical protein